MRKPTKNELRCFCSRAPLLAVYGLDKRGQLYVHVKIFKQNRIYGEMLVRGGEVNLHCRECLRWHTVKIVQPGTAVLLEDTEPQPIESEAPRQPMLAPRTHDNLR